MIYPSTATLTQPSGLGEDFGGALGGWQGAVTATIAPVVGWGDAWGEAFAGWQPIATAVLASNGISTASVTEVLVAAELQLV